MPLTKATLQSNGMFGNPDQIGYIDSSFYSGSGSLCIMPVTTTRFDSTGTIGFGDRLIFFWRYLIARPTTISGTSLRFTANTATTKTLTSITESSGTATATSTAHGFVTGDRIRISGASPSIYNGTKIVLSAPTADTFTFAITAGTGSASGTITAREFIGCAIYDYDKSNLLPRNKLVDCAILPATSNVITNFDANITLNAGMHWVGIGGSRFTNNTSLATIVQGNESSSMVGTLLFGEKTGSFSQFNGGVGVYAYDNVSTPAYLSDGNSGFAATLTAGLSVTGNNLVGVRSGTSSGNAWYSKCPMLGLVVA
jgi:hypothetical protein